MQKNMPDLSVIIPIKDEEDNIDSLARELNQAMGEESWECIWVNDGSSDRSLSILERLHESDERHRFISFERNAGQSAAFFAGFKEARGAIFAVIDGDGQNDPADIPRLVELVRSGQVDMANGYRQKRKDNLVRKVASKVANGFRNKMLGETVRDVGCSTRAFRRECASDLPRFAGMHRFLPDLVAMRGFRLGEYPVNHRPRLRGKSKYGINNRLWVGLLDVLGVLWLKRRGFSYSIARRDGAEPVAGSQGS
ncbi:MAG: glycosyltransferase family 2 protein [Acidobacteriota bacterium]